MFPGFGDHYLNMARELYENISIFRDNLNHCASIIRSMVEVDLVKVLYYLPDLKDKKKQFEKHLISGASLFSIEYALAKTYIELGVAPSAMIGYSMGEFAAACISEALSLNDILFLILEQARYIDTLSPGSMMAVMLSEENIQTYLKKGEIELAAVNGPSVCVVSGTSENILKLKTKIRKEKRIESILLNSPYGFHSYLVDSIVDQVSKIAHKIQVQAPKIKYISSVTSDWITENELKDTCYWSRKLREPVFFNRGILKIFDSTFRILLEVGPRQTLSLLVRNNPGKSKEQIVISSMPHLPGENNTELSSFFNSLLKLQQEGITIKWEKIESEILSRYSQFVS